MGSPQKQGFFVAIITLIYAIWRVIARAFSKKTLEFVAETNLPTLTGYFRVRAYRGLHTCEEEGNMEPIALVMGDVNGLENVPVRVHDACFTSEVIGSTKCDCREQLQYAMDYIRTNAPGIVIYLQQEGRGIGLANKIAAYSLQESGFDTVEANRKLGLPDDIRTYDYVIDILKDLNVKSIQLLTNNPRKIDHLRGLGLKVNGRLPVHIPPNEHNVNYLKTKVKKMNHLITDHYLEMQ
jgi:GTP cyclohydrolase II